jgi:hypothetical protein
MEVEVLGSGAFVVSVAAHKDKAQPDQTAPRWFGQSTAEGSMLGRPNASMLEQVRAAEDRYERWSDKRLAHGAGC